MISAGTEHTCALLADGEVRCWGVNFTGRLGTGSSDHSVVPLPVIGLHDAVWIAAGAGHTCAVDAARGLWCWGRNNHGQIGVGDDRDRLSPARVEVLERAMEVAAGMFHTCAIRFDGVPYCWGQNRFGQLGIGSDLGSSAVPLRVPGVTSAVSVDAGWTHACSLSSAGLVSCWGGDFGGEPLVLCGEDLGVEVCACDNGEDDDRDGLVDCFDEECADSLVCLGLECVPPSNALPEYFSFRRVVDLLTMTFTEEGSCGRRGQPEVVHSWYPPSTQFFDIELTHGLANGVLWVRSGRCDGPEVGCRIGANPAVRVRVDEVGTPLVIGVEAPVESSAFLVRPTPEVVCNDGRDDDLDGRVDCADSDCSSSPEC